MKRRLPKELTTVTTTSKMVALGLMVALPILGFFLGMRYQEALDANATTQTDVQNFYQQPTPMMHVSPTNGMMMHK